jgi:translation elongation factor EF-Tu-like GTPase
LIIHLYDGGWKADVAGYLTERILYFAEGIGGDMYGRKLDEIAEAQIKSAAKFLMPVEEVFQATLVTGAIGIVLGGTVKQGSIRKGDDVEVRGRSHTRKVKVFDVDALKGSGAPGEKIRLLMEDLTHDDVIWGDIVKQV